MLTHNRLHDHLLTHTTLLRTHFDCVEGNSWHIVTLEMLNGKYFSVGRPRMPCGHKHLHNNFFSLLPSFHIP